MPACLLSSSSGFTSAASVWQIAHHRNLYNIILVLPSAYSLINLKNNLFVFNIPETRECRASNGGHVFCPSGTFGDQCKKGCTFSCQYEPQLIDIKLINRMYSAQ